MWPQKLSYDQITDDNSDQTVARRSYSKLFNVESGILYTLFTSCPKASCVFDSLHRTSEQGLYLTVDKLDHTCILILRCSIEGLPYISTNIVFLHIILYSLVATSLYLL